MASHNATADVYVKGWITKRVEDQQCAYCHQSFSKKTGTATLRRHLRSCAATPDETKLEIFLHESTDMNTSNRRVEEVGINVFKPLLCPQPTKKIEDLLVKWILVNQQPYSIVEQEAFRNFCRQLNGSYELPGRRKFTELALSRLEDQKSVLQAALAKLDTRPACVCDLWKDIRGIHKLGVSITFITPDWKMWAVRLAVKEFPQRNTAMNIKAAVVQILTEFKVQLPLCYVADNCSTAVSANTMLVDDWTDEQRPLDVENVTEPQLDMEEYGTADPDPEAIKMLQGALQLETDSIGCHCHALELAIGEALSNATLKMLLVNLRSFVASYRSSSRTVQFVETSNSGIAAPFLPADVSTRWSSTHRLLAAFLEKKDIFIKASEAYAARDGTAQEVPGMEALDVVVGPLHMNILQTIKDVLEPIASAVTTLEGDQYPTMSFVQLLAMGLLQNVQLMEIAEKRKHRSSSTVLSVLATLKQSLTTRFLYPRLPLENNDMPIDYIAAALDPRTKDLTFLRDDKERDLVWAHIEQLWNSNCSAELEPALPTKEAASDPGSRLIMLLRKSAGNSPLTEVARYRSSPTVYDMEPLEFWKTYQLHYPGVAMLARNYLAVPASSATVERVFSRAGNALTKKSTRLSSANLDAQTCFEINAPFEEYLTNGNNIKKRKRPQDD